MGWGTGLQRGGDSRSSLSRCPPHLPHQLSLNKQAFTQPYPREYRRGPALAFGGREAMLSWP